MKTVGALVTIFLIVGPITSLCIWLTIKLAKHIRQSRLTEVQP